MFTIFMADLPKAVKSCLVQFADDSTLYRQIKDDSDLLTLQIDLNNIGIWCLNNGMALNIAKCTVMDVTLSYAALHYDYVINNLSLPYVKSVTTLGIFITQNLSWNMQTEYVKSKCAKILGFVYKYLRGCTLRVKRQAYFTLMSPY
jgi:hypothetical protein